MCGSGKRANGPSASGRGAGPPEQGVNNKAQQLVLPQHHNNQQQGERSLRLCMHLWGCGVSWHDWQQRIRSGEHGAFRRPGFTVGGPILVSESVTIHTEGIRFGMGSRSDIHQLTLFWIVATVVRQGVGSADTNQHSQMGGSQQNSDLKGSMPGRTSGNAGSGAAGVAKQPPTSKPPAPPTSLAAGSEADTPSGKQSLSVFGVL